MFILKKISFVAALLALSGCMSSTDSAMSDDYYADDFSMESSAKKEQPKQTEKSKKQPEKQADSSVAPARTSSSYAQVSEVSKRVEAVAAKLKQIQDNISKNSASFRDLKAKSAREADQYYDYVGRIHARLQRGTTPGNPELTEMWKQASALLSGMDKDISETAKVSTETVRTNNELTTLLDTIRETYQVPGAMEVDHENLKALEDEANQTSISLNRLTNDISAQITRQQQYYSSEKQNINALETDIQNGKSMGLGTVSAATPIQAQATSLIAAADVPDADIAGRRPLMVIRFDKRKVAYEQQLFQAVKTALDKRPNTQFELVAVSPANAASGDVEAVKNAEAVRSSLTAMGLPAARISMSKTKSATIKTTEVHLYLK